MIKMDVEFKSEEDKWNFCAMIYETIKEAYETCGAIHIQDPTVLFRLMRVLEDIYYDKM